MVGYKTQPDTGTFSYACHACAVEVDVATGQTRLLDYAICEDGGVLLNPQIVEGQLIGGLAQGIGTALYEEMPFDAEGQPLASTLADYLMPGAAEMPPLKIVHMETPSPHSLFGQKGIGEGGAIAPPAAIVNAINDALHALGAEVTECPASPVRVLAAIAASPQRSPRMKAAAYQLLPAESIAGAAQALRDGGFGCKPVAGGQSLGAMLNLRLAQPDALLDLDAAATAAERSVKQQTASRSVR